VTDYAFLVLIVMMALSFLVRVRMLAVLGHWTPAERSRLFAAFYRQNKLTAILWLLVIALMLVPVAVGKSSDALTFGPLLAAAAIAIVGGVWSNRRLRGMDFPASYVRLHAVQSAVLSTGVAVFAALMLAAH